MSTSAGTGFPEAAPLIEENRSFSMERNDPTTANRTLLQTLPKWWLVAKLWFQGEEKWRARSFIVFTVVLSLVRTYMFVKISYNQRNLETSMAERDKVNFEKAVWGFGGIILVAAPLFAVTDFVEDRLKVEWRQWLTAKLLEGYYANRSYYRLHQHELSVDNPDQRICDDVPSFVEASTDLFLGLMRKVFGVIAFSGVLWSVAPSLVLFLFAYTAIGTWITTSAFGRRLMQLTYTVLRQEGDLRFTLVRTRENSESIAFYSGEARESALAWSKLRLLVAFSKLKISWMAGLSLWSNLYSYVTLLLPPLLTAPRYFAGEVEFGVITQVGFAFRNIEIALNYLVNNLDKFSSLAAEAERLGSLMTVLAAGPEEAPGILHLRHDLPCITLEALTVHTPNGRQLICKGLDLVTQPGQSLLILGTSGCGKSSLLRAICGLWSQGSGIVHAPRREDMFFLPQKPYMPLGSLRQQLLYPSGGALPGQKAKLNAPEPSDDELSELLDRVSLSGLLERAGGFDAEAEWSHLLSLGEQQRIAFLRLLLHRPALCFLDEATGALDSATEAVLYKALQSQSSSYISVGHRKELYAFHTHVLQHLGDAQWSLAPMSEHLWRQR